MYMHTYMYCFFSYIYRKHRGEKQEEDDVFSFYFLSLPFDIVYTLQQLHHLAVDVFAHCSRGCKHSLTTLTGLTECMFPYNH